MFATPGTVRRHAHAELAGEARVGARHVRGAGLVPRRHDLDAELVQARVEAEVRAVDDAEDLLDAFRLEHARQDFATAGFAHGAPGRARAASRCFQRTIPARLHRQAWRGAMPLDFRGFPRWQGRGARVHEAAIHWLPMLVALLGAGAAGGLLAGLLGVGGGIVIVPALDMALTLAGVDPTVALHVAVGTSMATIVPTSISSSRSHARRGAVDFEVIRRWSLPIVVGALAGALLASRVDARVLAGVFGERGAPRGAQDAVAARPARAAAVLPGGSGGALIPGFIGLVSAMMGIGGGTLTRAGDDALRRAGAQGGRHGGAARTVDQHAGHARLTCGRHHGRSRCRRGPWAT